MRHFFAVSNYFVYLCTHEMERQQFKENVLLVDADYVDSVAADMRLNFSRMIQRDIPEADLAEWLVCAALDGGVKEVSPQGDGQKPANTQPQQEIQVVFIRSLAKTWLEHFNPGNLICGIDGQAFTDTYTGEYLISVVPEEKPMTGQDNDPLFVESARYLQNCSEVKRLILVPDMLRYGALLKADLAEVGEGAAVVLLTMQPEEGRGFTTETLGYSLLHALGIAPEELR